MDPNYKELPITSLIILSDKSKCPPRYELVDKSHDTQSDLELWVNGLFGKKSNRFICYTKEFPIMNTFNVIEDIKLFSERESTQYGYSSVDRAEDTGEKAFQRKTLCVKISPRYLTNEAVSDVIFLAKSKRGPAGYLLVGEINNHSLCVKYSRVPQQPHRQIAPSTGFAYPQATPPPLPPRPPSHSQLQHNATGHHTSASNDGFMKTVQRIYESTDHYNPLQGVPFQINPIYSKQLNLKNGSFDTDLIDKYTRLNDLLSKFDYNFNLERSIVGYSTN